MADHVARAVVFAKPAQIVARNPTVGPSPLPPPFALRPITHDLVEDAVRFRLSQKIDLSKQFRNHPMLGDAPEGTVRYRAGFRHELTFSPKPVYVDFYHRVAYTGTLRSRDPEDYPHLSGWRNIRASNAVGKINLRLPMDGSFPFQPITSPDPVEYGLPPLVSIGGFTMAEPYQTPRIFVAPFLATGQVVKGEMESYVPTPVDPVTLKPAYRLVIVDSSGFAYAELENAQLSPLTNVVGGERGTFAFTLPISDKKAAECMAPQREVQVWRGSRLVWWGVLVRAKDDGKVLEVQCATLEWYFGKRVIGPVPKRNMLVNPRFANGTANWTFSRVPGSKPNANPNHEAVQDPVLTSGNSMLLRSSQGRPVKVFSADDWFGGAKNDVLTSDAKSDLNTIIADLFGTEPRVMVRVHHDNVGSQRGNEVLTQRQADAVQDYIADKKPGARVRAYGRGETKPVGNNGTAAGRKANRRVVIAYRDEDGINGGMQYAGQQFTVRNTAKNKRAATYYFSAWVYIEEYLGSAAHNWGLVLELRDPRKKDRVSQRRLAKVPRLVKRSFVGITGETPQNRWVRMEASVKVPADARPYLLCPRIFAFNGDANWAEAWLTSDVSLDFSDVDQAVIMAELLEHAQDESLGKGSLGIRPSIPATKVPRTRRYVFADRQNILEAMDEFQSLANGMEWDIAYTAENRYLRTYYPRKGKDTAVVLDADSNLLTYEMESDAEQTANSIMILTEGESPSREERSVTDSSALDGIILEKAYQATPGSAVSSLLNQAIRGLARYRKNVDTPSVTVDPIYTDQMLRDVTTGDRVRFKMRDGYSDIYGWYRVTSMTLDPDTDTLSFTLVPEDAKVVSLSAFNSKGETGWKYKTGTSAAYATAGYNDSSWAVGEAGFGRVIEGDVTGLTDYVPKTAISANDFWLRKKVRCTGDMYISLRVDRYAWIYVNGNLVGDRVAGRITNGRGNRGPFLVPQDYLSDTGMQQIAVHFQDDVSDGTGPNAFYGDVLVRGTISDA